MTRRQLETYHYAVRILDRYGFTPDDLDTLHRAETALTHIHERVCSDPMPPAETARLERKEETIEAKIKDVCREHGLKVSFQGDCRGCCIQIQLPTKPGREAWPETVCVDW